MPCRRFARFLLSFSLALSAGKGALASDLESMVEGRSRSQGPRAWYVPSIVWMQTSLSPLRPEEDAPTVATDNNLGFSFRLAKKKKISLNLESRHSFFLNQEEDEESRKDLHGMGDASLKYTDKSFEDLWGSSDLLMSHKLAFPTSERSQERKLIAKYKSEYILSSPGTAKLDLLTKFIPSIYASEEKTYRNSKGRLKANKIYDASIGLQALYEITPGLYASADTGFLRLQYQGSPEIPAQHQDAFLNTVSLITTLAQGKLTIALGLTSETPTNKSTFKNPNLFTPAHTSYYLETYLAAF